jgi:hypothetical protein
LTTNPVNDGNEKKETIMSDLSPDTTSDYEKPGVAGDPFIRDIVSKFDPIPSNLQVTPGLSVADPQLEPGEQPDNIDIAAVPAPWTAKGTFSIAPATGAVITYVALPLNFDGTSLNGALISTGTATFVGGPTRAWQINNLPATFASGCPVVIILTFRASDGKFKIGSAVVFPPY